MLSREKSAGSQAVSRLPRVPSAGLETKVDAKLVGRKVLALKVSMRSSFVSWRQTTEEFASLIALRTMVHLSGSLKPRMFQDTM